MPKTLRESGAGPCDIGGWLYAGWLYAGGWEEAGGWACTGG